MTAFGNAFTPPPPFGLFVIGRHGASKYKVKIGKLTKIVDRDTVLQWAQQRRNAGGSVNLNGFIHEAVA